MSISLIQILLVLLSVTMLWNSFSKFAKRQRGQTMFKLISSLFIWGSVLTFSLFPYFSHTLARALGFGENLNTLIFLGFVVIFLILTKIIAALERVESSISEIVRKEALEHIEKK